MILLAFYFEYLNCFDEIFVELEFCDVLTNKLFAMDSRHLNTNCLNILTEMIQITFMDPNRLPPTEDVWLE